MANLGDLITTVEDGWQRFDDNDPHINYVGNGWHFSTWASNTYETSTAVIINPESADCAKFNFIGSKIRLYGVGYSSMNSGNKVVIDGVSYPMALWSKGSNNKVFLTFEKLDFDFKEHSVVIVPNDSARIYLDALDIDDQGKLIPYAPIAPINLIATAGDSQVTVSWNAVEGAASYNIKRSTTAGGPYTIIATNVTDTSYIDNTVTNGTTYYYVVTAVDSSDNESANSNEASAIPQAPTGYGLLRITMNDSSEREYQLSTTEIDGFINWVKDHASTDPNCYMLNKIEVLQSSKEYLMFEKIISFEVIELTK